MARYIGIQHRVKMTAEQEAHPTRVAILIKGRFTRHDLKTEQDELDFVLSEIKQGDVVSLILGGSGDYLAYALSRQAKLVGAQVMRIPSFALKEKRGEESKDDDAALLARLAEGEPHLFYPLAETDAALIRARESWRALWEAMQARMAGELRLRQLYIGRAFTAPDGLYPEGGIEKGFDALKASDPIAKTLRAEEAARERELVKALEALPVYTGLFKPIEGVGAKIAARIIASVVDIRRFETAAKLKKYMGAHVLSDGTFPRRRRGQLANWHGDARQALYLLAEQFNRRPNSEWGIYLRQMKTNLRVAHPKPVLVDSGNGKKVKRYTDGHIHKMALWRTVTRFVEWLHGAWTDLESAERPEDLRKAA